MDNMRHLAGTPVCITEGVTYQNVNLSEEVQVSDEFRESFNKWLRDQYGWKSSMKTGQVYLSAGVLFMNQATWNIINSNIK